MSTQFIAFVFIFFLATTLTNASLAQDGSSSPVPTSLSTTLEQVQDVANPLFTAATITQAHSLAGTASLGNSAQIVQNGDGNSTILRQYGTQNVASVHLDGDGNSVDATQDGNQNRLDVSVLGDGNRVPIAQLGNGNALTVELVNVNDLFLDPPVGIQQTGGGVPLIVRITPSSP